MMPTSELHDQVVELVGNLGEHRLREAAAERLRFVHDGTQLVAGLAAAPPFRRRGSRRTFSRPHVDLRIDALIEGR